MCGGSKTQQTQQQSTQATGPTPQFSNLLSQQGTNTAALGLTNPSSLVAPVAGFTAPQFNGFDVAQAQANSGLSGLATPYIQNAAQIAGNQTPVTAASVQAGLNPFINDQVAALQGQLALQNAQTTAASNSNAAKLGALTGDRSQVANQIATNNNNLNAATATSGLESGAYGQAANIALQNNANDLGRANILGQLGSEAQNTGLANVNSLLGIGGQQQGQQQAENNYGASVAGAPLSLQQWLNSQLTGLSSGAGTQSTGNSTTTQPGPNLISQLLGLGIAGFGAASGTKAASGGRINGYAPGGVVVPLDVWDGLSTTTMPTAARPAPSLAMASGPQAPSNSFQMPNASSLSAAGRGLGNIWSAMNTTTDPESGWSTTVSPSFGGLGSYFSNTFGFRKGGGVRGYDDGGMVGDDATPALMRDPSIMDAVPNDDGVWDTTATPGATVATQGSYQPTSGTAPASGGSDGLIGNPLGLTDAGRQGVIAAGLGMMASRAPWIGTAIGEGGLQGVNAYQKQRQLDTTEAYRKATIANQGERLANQADAIANRLKLGTRNSDIAQQKADQTNDYHTRMADIADQRAKEISSRIIDPATRADMFAKDMAATEFKADPTQNLTARTDYWRNYWHQRYEPQPTAPAGTAAPLAPVPQFAPQGLVAPQGGNDMLAKARDAIARGADRSAVVQRLQSQDIDPSGL